jgi:RecA-family ATPase
MSTKNPITETLEGAAPVYGPGVILARASDIKMRPIDWLWRDWLPCGMLTLLAGAPGQGKTTLAMAMAATVSTGGVWPDGSRCAPGSVLIWTCEDEADCVLNPRLVGMGSDLSRVHYIQGTRLEDGRQRPFDAALDMPGLLAAAQAIGNVRLVIVDPVVSAITGDSHKNAEVRQGLQPLVDLASNLGAAVLGITHLSKGSAGRDPAERVIGSIAFCAVARMVLLAAKAKDDDRADKRILVRAKTNIAPCDDGYEYHLNQVQAAPGITASIASWGQAIEGKALELLAEAESEPDGEDGALASAQEFLRELLADGLTPSKQVKADAQ